VQVTGPAFASNSGDPVCRLTYKHSVQGRYVKSAQKIWRDCGYRVESVEKKRTAPSMFEEQRTENARQRGKVHTNMDLMGILAHTLRRVVQVSQ
jgi:hypothetical protein